MRHLILLVIATLTFCSCVNMQSSTNYNLDEKVVNHSYQNVIFESTSNNIQLDNGLTLSVTPINASEFNLRTYFASTLNGSYEQELIRENYITPNQREMLSRSELDFLENLEEITMEILDAIENGEISDKIGRHLISRMWEGEKIGKDGSEVESFTGRGFLPTSNPYHINNQYLSVFKLELQNQGSSLLYFDRNAIQLHNGVESLKPFTTNYFDEVHTNHQKIENALRFNLPERLTVLPGQQTTKYFATHAIDTDIESIYFNIINDDSNKFEKIEFDVSTVLEEREIRMKSFVIDAEFRNDEPRYPGSTRVPSTDLYYSVEIADRSFPLKSNRFYATEDELNEQATICIAAFDDTSALQSKFACTEFDLSDYPDRVFKIGI